MRNALSTTMCLFTMTMALSTSEAGAAIIVSNLDQPRTGAGLVGYNAAFSSSQQYAQEFTTGNQASALDSIVATLGGATGSFSGFAELRTSNADSPGTTILTRFTFPTVGTTLSNLSFLPTTSGVMLAANTAYWFVLGSSSGTGSFSWEYTSSTTVTGPGTLPNYARSFDGGSTYTTTNGAPFLIQVNSVPEPGSLALCGVACLIGLGCAGYRRGRAILA